MKIYLVSNYYNEDGANPVNERYEIEASNRDDARVKARRLLSDLGFVGYAIIKDGNYLEVIGDCNEDIDIENVIYKIDSDYKDVDCGSISLVEIEL